MYGDIVFNPLNPKYLVV